MNLGIVRIVELLQHETIRGFGKQFLSFGDSALHTIWTWREDNFCTKGEQKDASLQTHGFGHRQD